jgi:ABC-type antimicrobial peptide transport system permease subunit
VAATRPYFVVRSTRPASELLPAIRAVVRQLDAQAVVSANPAAMSDLFAESVARPRFNAALLSAFAGVANALAAVALYGVLAHAVSERTREIGVRMALGARRSDVLRLVLRQSAAMTGAGLLLGMAGAAAGSRWLQALLFGVTPLDASTLGAASLALAAVAAVASYVPVSRAIRIDPAAALRGQ